MTSESNKTMNFGYYRFEPIGALVNCVSIWGLTVYLVVESVGRLMHPPSYFNPRVMLVTASFGVAANLCMAGVVYGFAVLPILVKYPCLSDEEKAKIYARPGTGNLNIRAVVAHIHGDLVYSVGVLIGAIAININERWIAIDPVLTILFSFVVLHITLPVFKETIRSVSEANPDSELHDTITKEIYGLEKVNKINSLRIWSLTQDQICATVHITCAEGTDEQSLQHKIGKIMQTHGAKYSTIQVWKMGTVQECPYHDNFI